MSSHNEAKSRGRLIVFEGLDRSGKSTQCAKLVEDLQRKGHKVKHMRFPDRSTAIGTSIDAYLRSTSDLEDHTIHLLFSANRWESASQMRADLAAGTTLVVDRYSFSGAVYSAAKQNPTLSLDWAWQAEIGLPRPDLVLYLTVSEDVARQRGGFGGERYEKVEMQRRVGAVFELLFRERLAMGEPELRVVDADKSVEAVHAEVARLATELLADGGDKKLGSFEALLG